MTATEERVEGGAMGRPIRRKEDALTIPAAYVVEGKYVLTGPDERTPVTIGVKDMEKVEVLEGIDASTQLYKP